MKQLDNTKICTKCGGLPQPLSEFHKKASHSTGFSPWCKKCCRQSLSSYYQNNKEKIKRATKSRYIEKRQHILIQKKEYQKKYCRENKDKIRLRQSKYYAENKDKIAAYHANRYAQNKELILKRNASWRQNNKGKISQIHDEYYKQNRQHILEYGKKWRKENSERYKLIVQEWQIRNIDRVKIKHKEWSANNRDRRNAIEATRRCAKLNATPSWLNSEDLMRIDCFYLAAKCITKFAGIKIEVDHIIPLKGKNVRGLHVPWNLQLLPSHINKSKGNKV